MMSETKFDTDIEVIFQSEDGSNDDCFFEDSTEALLEIAARLIRKQKVVFISVIARINFDFDKGVFGS